MQRQSEWKCGIAIGRFLNKKQEIYRKSTGRVRGWWSRLYSDPSMIRSFLPSFVVALLRVSLLSAVDVSTVLHRSFSVRFSVYRRQSISICLHLPEESTGSTGILRRRNAGLCLIS